MKIICAGLQKTGTKSLAEALRKLGYKVHDVFEQIYYDEELWDKVLDNTATVNDYHRVLQDVDAVMDMPAVAVWEQIMEAFPDAKIILTIRTTEDEWYESAKNHYKAVNEYVPQNEILSHLLPLLFGPTRQKFIRYETAFIPACLGTSRLSGVPIETILRSRYRQHNLYVKSICPHEKLLIYNVKDGWGPLCKFLQINEPDLPFPEKNKSGEIVYKVAAGVWEHDCGYTKKVMRDSFTRVGTFLIIFLAFISFIIYLLI